MYLAPNTNQKALEMTMRDVLDSMGEDASFFALHHAGHGFDILSIEPPCDDLPAPTAQAAEIVPFSRVSGQ